MEGTCYGNMNGNNSSSGLCPNPIMMTVPLVTSYHATTHDNNNTTTNPNLINNDHNPNRNPSANTNSSSVFLPMPSCTNSNQNRSSIMLENHNNNNNTNTGLGYFMEIENNNNGGSSSSSSAVKAKIMAHPHYHRLVAAYVNCQKVGAPPEVVARLEEACASAVRIGESGAGGSIGEDPGLDQFMEAYCEMLIKYHQQLSKPFNEAMLFFQRIHSQFNSLTISPYHSAGNEASNRKGCTSEEDDTAGAGAGAGAEVGNNAIDPQAEDGELKGQLLRKYSGYLGNLKQEFMKKRKKGKLPKEARQQLLEWWTRHYKWPYPSESQKLALAESTGLDQKQINNWFINQRKRHWKPSEDMQFVVVDPSAAAHNHPHYYMDNLLVNPFPMPMDLSHTML